MQRTPVLFFVRWVSRRALSWTYREIHFRGTERIPPEGAVLLIGNHPNDLPDVLSGFFTTRRQVRYLATVSATTMPFASTVYRGIGVIPVMRIRDVRGMRKRGIDGATVNATAQQSVTEALSAGEMVGAFPEGGVHDTPHVGKFRTGVAKMALNALDSVANTDALVIPFGVQYEAGQVRRSDVVVDVGHPFSLREWANSVEDRSPSALSHRLHQALSDVCRNSSDWARANERDRLIAAVAAISERKSGELLDGAAVFQSRCAELVEGAGASDSPQVDDLVHWRTIANSLAAYVERAGGIGSSARDTARVLDSAGFERAGLRDDAKWPSTAWLIAVSAPAGLGLVLHAPLWHSARWLGGRVSEVRTDPIARTILPGLHLIFLGYLILGGLLALGFRAAALSTWWALPSLMLLPRLGDLGLAWLDAIRARRLRARVHRFSATDRAAIVATADRVRSAWARIVDTSLSSTPPS